VECRSRAIRLTEWYLYGEIRKAKHGGRFVRAYAHPRLKAVRPVVALEWTPAPRESFSGAPSLAQFDHTAVRMRRSWHGCEVLEEDAVRYETIRFGSSSLGHDLTARPLELSGGDQPPPSHQLFARQIMPTVQGQD
jgi:hypothetical protein